MAYRFRPAEIEAMKEIITTHCECEYKHEGIYSAWRLRVVLQGKLYCCCPSKREAAKLERELWLFESLTDNDRPNWEKTITA